MRRGKSNKHQKTVGIIIGVVILLVLFNPMVIVSPGERGVVTQFGKPVGIMDEGLNFKAPLAQNVIIVDVKTQKIETKSSAASKDLQSVSSIIALNYHLAPNGVLLIIQNIGTLYKSRVIDPAIQESVKAATAKFTAEELITKRPLVREEIKTLLTEKLNELSKNTIIVDEFNIIDFQFSPEFATAVEAKVTAEQQALKAEKDLQRIKIEAEQRVAQASGEADAVLLQAKAQAEALKLQRQQVTSELNTFKAIERWNGVLPTIVGGDKIPLILDTKKVV